MSTGLIEIVKVAALNAIEQSKPMDIRKGTVIEANPLRIKITNELILPESVLIVPQRLKTYDVDVFVDWSDDTSGNQKLTIRNSLTEGDNVILLRIPGGKQFYVLDKV